MNSFRNHFHLSVSTTSETTLVPSFNTYLTPKSLVGDSMHME